MGGTTLRSIGHIARLQRIAASDNQQLVSYLRSTHGVAEEHNDVATTSLIEAWIDETERRAWFLFETSRTA